MPTSLSIGRARTKVHAMNAIGRHNGRQEEEEESLMASGDLAAKVKL